MAEKMFVALQACNAAIEAIAELEPGKWPGMVTLILEALDCKILPARRQATAFLEAVRGDLDIRLETGQW